MFPIEKYRFYYDDKWNPRKVIAVSSYAGRSVRGVAQCHPNDEFSREKGQQLAAARCGAEIAKKRLARAHAKYKEALAQMEETKKYVESMKAYYIDSMRESDEAELILEHLETEM